MICLLRIGKCLTNLCVCYIMGEAMNTHGAVAACDARREVWCKKGDGTYEKKSDITGSLCFGS